MNIDLIFFSKNSDSASTLRKEVKAFLEDKLNYKYGYIIIDGISIDCFINEFNIKKSVMVRIEINNTDDDTIMALDKLKEIIKNNSKEKFYLTISYDGLSRYFSDKLYPLIAEFETKLRSIAYNTLINDLGYNWVSETFEHHEKTKNKLKKFENKSKENKEKEYNQLIQKALDEFYLKDLGTYLFSEYQYPNNHMIVEELLNLAKTSSINQDQIDDIESKIVPKSLMRRYFDNDDLEYIRNKFNIMNDARNDVMHHKEITLGKYNKYDSLLNKSLSIVNSLHEETNIGNYNKVDIGEIASAFSNAYKSMNLYNKSIDGLRDVINTELSIASKASINSIGESIKSQIPASAIESLTIPMKDHFSNIAKSAFDYNSTIKEFANAQRQIGELAGVPKMQDLIKPAISGDLIQNNVMKAIEDNNKRIMNLPPSFGESFSDGNDIEEDEDSDQSK